jgi:hypothetical protein
MRMNALPRIALLSLTAALGCAPVGDESRTASVVPWTVLVFMNGDNDLEPFAIKDFMEIARIGSTDSVHVVVQLDRIKVTNGPRPGWDATDYGDWSHTLRFRVTKGMTPIPANALGDFNEEANMGDGATLSAFVEWARRMYPARRYALIIWDHGAGWRLMQPGAEPASAELSSAAKIDRALFGGVNILGVPSASDSAAARKGPVYDHPVKSVSHDATSNSELFNRSIQTALETLLGNQRLAVLGFDACLMAMVETGYAFRNVAETVVASEELEPGDGWAYHRFLQPLVANSSMTGGDVGRAIVSAYSAEYPGPSPNTTLSAIDASQMTVLANGINQLAIEMSRAIGDAAELRRITTARQQCDRYAVGWGPFHNIDLRCLLNALTANARDGAVLRQVAALDQQLTATVLGSYANEPMREPRYVSAGVAIYFPPTKSAFDEDPLASAYRNGLPADQFPVQFVDDFGWDEFLVAYLKRVP